MTPVATTGTDGTDAAGDPLPTRLDIGQAAPDFTLPAVMPDGTTTGITLSDVLAQRRRRVILYCYPAAMTPGCTTQACDFRDNIARLGGMGYTVLGMSKDPIDKLERFRQRDQLTFPLLSDPDLRVHRLYGAYGEKKLYGRTHVGVLRSTFVIGTDGRIELARYNVRAKGHIDSLIKALGKLDDAR
ncbi:peroxiredoxin [Bifidobacterium samirii]|uniref:thioredoxin-dependent peroxiredoxin n=1 Tax=Bifidobacterium samirii TaxID=2306974 RepID=A0A430FWQ5_9BIFI|nr:peroxiredoxin [Bifidobacterium samirii]RSX58709.1 peroxiredoxin [Bifidobacterium samirii]